MGKIQWFPDRRDLRGVGLAIRIVLGVCIVLAVIAAWRG